MPVFDRFVPTLAVSQAFGYLVDVRDTAVIDRLRRHGFDVEQANPSEGAADEFVVDSIIRAPRPFQGHNEVRITGRWRHVQRTAMSQRVFIAAAGRLEGALAMYLLDPESDDGFTTWGLFGDRLRVGEPHPVLRQRMGGSSGR